MRLAPATTERIVVASLWGLAAVTIGVLLYVIGYILVQGLPHIGWTFLTAAPESMGRKGGIFPMVVGTILVAGFAVLIAAPVGVATAIYLTEYTREGRLTAVIRFGADCLAGIPSIIFGLFGFVFFVIYLNLGWSILSGGLTLAAMILPTIISTAEEAIKAIPNSYRQVSYSLGATKWQTVTRAILPSALPGIFTGIILSVGRSIGETAAVILTAGSTLVMPTTLFSPVRTLSVHFYILAREGISMEMAYGTGAALILLVLFINTIAHFLINRYIRRRS
jgi:phosphate transport system permease protein